MNDVEQLGLEIAKKLTIIKNAQQEKLVVENEIQALNVQISTLKESLNKLDATITSTKYEITHRMNEIKQSALTVIKTEN